MVLYLTHSLTQAYVDRFQSEKPCWKAKMRDNFTASRWTQDNHFFPATLTITGERVTLRRDAILGFAEHSIPRNQISSVTVKMGMLFAGVRIGSSGSKEIVWYGFTRADALAIRELLEVKI